MKHFLRLNSSIPEEQRVPGVPLDWPVTHYPVDDEADDLTDPDLIKCDDDAALAAYYAARQAAFDAGLAEQMAYKAEQALPGIKRMKIAEIDTRTREVIFRGFTYAGKVLSLSASAQANLLSAETLKDSYSYPIFWNCLDDLEEPIELADAAAVTAMCLAAETAKTVARDSGTELRGQVLEATSKAEVDAIADSR